MARNLRDEPWVTVEDFRGKPCSVPASKVEEFLKADALEKEQWENGTHWKQSEEYKRETEELNARLRENHKKLREQGLL